MSGWLLIEYVHISNVGFSFFKVVMKNLTYKSLSIKLDMRFLPDGHIFDSFDFFYSFNQSRASEQDQFNHKNSITFNKFRIAIATHKLWFDEIESWG